MNKILILSLFFTLTLSTSSPIFSEQPPASVFAEQARNVMLCPFTETIVIKDAPAGTHILKLSADGLMVQQQGTQQFLISNKPNCQNGTVTADIGLNQDNHVVMVFHDGPLMFMSIKSIDSHGSIQFQKWNPDNIKHYYELNFQSTEMGRG